MWRRGPRFRMPARTAIIAWVLIAVGAISMEVSLITAKNQSVDLMEIVLLGAGLVGLAIVIFAFNHYVFRDCDPRKRKS